MNQQQKKISNVNLFSNLSLWSVNCSGSLYSTKQSGALRSDRIREWLGLEGTSRGHLVQSPYLTRTIWSWLPRTMSRWVANISKDGVSTTSLGNLPRGLKWKKQDLAKWLNCKKCKIMERQKKQLQENSSNLSISYSRNSNCLQDVTFLLAQTCRQGSKPCCWKNNQPIMVITIKTTLNLVTKCSFLWKQ